MYENIFEMLFFFVVCFCVFLAPLHSDFLLTEEELERLEKISEELKAHNNQLKKQQVSLKTTVAILKKSLIEKENSLKSLEDSFASFENEVMKERNIQEAKIASLNIALIKAKKWRRIWCCFSVILSFIVIFYVGIKLFCLFKMKKI